MKKVYIAGKITDEDYEIVKAQLDAVESDLREAGFEPVNPTKIAPFKEGMPWEYYMKICIKAMLDCDMVLLLPNWKESKGAILEKEIAYRLNIETMYLK